MSLFDKQVLQATVVVKTIWARAERLPLQVELASGTSAEAWAWEQEAKRWLHWIGLCNRYQRRVNFTEFLKGQPVPDFWHDLAGEHPGEDDPILSKEFKCADVYYLSGPVRKTEKVVKAPVTN